MFRRRRPRSTRGSSHHVYILAPAVSHAPTLLQAFFWDSFFLHRYLFQVSVLTHWYIHSPCTPHPPAALSDWPTRAPPGARCSRWKAVAVHGHPSAALWMRLYLHAVSESGKSPWTIAGPPCILERTSRAEVPWEARHPDYSAMVPSREPCRKEWTRTCGENEKRKERVRSKVLLLEPKDSCLIRRLKLSKTAYHERDGKTDIPSINVVEVREEEDSTDEKSDQHKSPVHFVQECVLFFVLRAEKRGTGREKVERRERKASGRVWWKLMLFISILIVNMIREKVQDVMHGGGHGCLTSREEIWSPWLSTGFTSVFTATNTEAIYWCTAEAPRWWEDTTAHVTGIYHKCWGCVCSVIRGGGWLSALQPTKKSNLRPDACTHTITDLKRWQHRGGGVWPERPDVLPQEVRREKAAELHSDPCTCNRTGCPLLTWMRIFPKQTDGVLSSAMNMIPWK